MSPTVRRRRARRLALPLFVPALAVSAVALPGTVGAGAAGPPPDDPNIQTFCAIAGVINSQAGAPTEQQVAAYAAVAPEQLAEPLALVQSQLAENGGDFTAIFGNPDVQAAIGSLTEAEVATCGDVAAGEQQDPSVTQIDESATRVDMTFADYEFVGDFPTAAGRYSFVFTNEGAEPHIAVLFQVADGFTLDDVLAAEGEAGVAVMYESSLGAPGGDPAVLTADLTPGEWVMLCPIPDANGTPHLAHGMIHSFTIA